MAKNLIFEKICAMTLLLKALAVIKPDAMIDYTWLTTEQENNYIHLDGCVNENLVDSKVLLLHISFGRN